MTTTLVKAGKLLCVDCGAYSDYNVLGFFVVLRDFDPHAELATYLDANPKQRGRYRFKEDAFLAALLAKGLLLEIEYGNLYTGAYSDHTDFRFTPASS